MSALAARQQSAAPAAVSPARQPLRRACACGTHTPLGGDCEGCKKKRVQAKFAIGAAGDAFEREADAVADQVLRREPAGRVARAPVQVQRQADRAGDGADAPASVDRVLARGGTPLDPMVRTDMEARFGHDFSQVRTHTDAAAARSAQEIDAAAYTAGHHVVFGHGRYAPATTNGRHLLAHELTHVLQQTPGIVRRAPPKPSTAKAPAKPSGTKAKDGPKLTFLDAKNPPPCACLVFIHNDERNARVIAKMMHEFCHYNLAFVDQKDGRLVNLPRSGAVDPNGLFPRDVIEQCWDSDAPCETAMADKADKTSAADVEAYAQRQFFLSVKHCSKGFTLPVVGLHNNAEGDTASYRAATSRTKNPLDLAPIRGKTFDDTLRPGDPAPAGTLPFSDLETWMKALEGVADNDARRTADRKTDEKNQKDADAAKAAGGTPPVPVKTERKHYLKGGPFVGGNTNIFIWCGAADNSKCHIGDPAHPDNVVWVTNEADFDRLKGTPTNVALQTRVDLAGDSASDLSSLFVSLTDIVGVHYRGKEAQLSNAIAASDALIKQLLDAAAVLAARGNGMAALFRRMVATMERRRKDLLVADLGKVAAERLLKDRQRRYINIETPPKGGSTAARVDGLAHVRATLGALGLDCCDTTPEPGQTQSAAQKLEDAVSAGELPKPKAAAKKKGKAQ